MNKENEKSEYITKTDLSEQTQIILGAMDKRFGAMDKKIDEVREELYIVRDELKEDINNVKMTVDGYVKAQEDFKEEFVIMKEENKQIKSIIKEKLNLEVSAV